MVTFYTIPLRNRSNLLRLLPALVKIDSLQRIRRIDMKLRDFGCAKQLDDYNSMIDTSTIRYKAPVRSVHC